ncbi:ATP-dependent protease ATPase subunit HslU [Blastopirellula retiformator]|uniref:ATP-dependent protease ATPase subunit HslU n=1 Tax=Blastopirellula retiformator TaxID=2527970 RepID=A0A5C5V981_9BACT|nr:ATP-dependent protease ATPase subunit HslU [Blastopirellula retiformator]TWT34272.1 ATP-dependent protease ATPase subunit ClpY [Blastopirellula retiformator]
MSTASKEMTPREIVAALDQNIVGQADAKRAVAVAVRNRWRRKQLPEELQNEIAPKNILMMGPTGVGKTEIARRLAKLTGAPFLKLEATKYTEVGYYGRDVESMVRELVETSIAMVRERERKNVEKDATARVEERLLDLLVPRPVSYEMASEEEDATDHYERTRERFRGMLRGGELEQRKVELTIEQKSGPMMIGGMGLEQMDVDLQGMFEKILPKNSTRREMTITEARKVLLEQESESLLDKEAISQAAIELAENLGIIFLDEIDKIIATDGKGADVSRQGVQRDLLPIVEGTTVQTKHGYVSTDHVLFIAAGAFHKTSPSELMPELQGRFPIRVELNDLTKEDFVRILTEPNASLTMQYQSLLETEGLKITFTDDALEELASFAFHVNQTTQNIGARRLYTIMERLLEELSFDASDRKEKKVTIDADYVRERLTKVSQDEDLSRFIL